MATMTGSGLYRSNFQIKLKPQSSCTRLAPDILKPLEGFPIALDGL